MPRQLEWLHANLCDRVTTQGLLSAVQAAACSTLRIVSAKEPVLACVIS